MSWREIRIISIIKPDVDDNNDEEEGEEDISKIQTDHRIDKILRDLHE